MLKEKGQLKKFFIFYSLLFFLFCARKEFHYTRFIVGGPCEITFYSSQGGIANTVVMEIDNELFRIDSLLSYFSEKSLITEINRYHRAKLDKDLVQLFLLCDSIAQITSGLFDISVAPLLEVWGFYSGEPRIPDKKELEKAIRRVDNQKIVIKNDSIFTPLDMKIDLAGIAQGFAADQVGKIFRRYNIRSAIINIAGEILAIGNSPHLRPWRVGIKHPRAEGIIETVELTDNALATSGDYEKFFVINGKRLPHIINPVTGLPSQEFASVTIFDKSAAFADGIATAVAIMGPEQGLKFLDSLNIKGIIYYEEDGRLIRVANED